MKAKTVFVSDIHLGSRHAAVTDFLNFLSSLKEDPPEKLYIVGDFIDGWKLRRNWYWTNDNNLVLRRLLGLIKKGTQIYYIAGNHDEFVRDFIEDFALFDLGSIHIGNEFVHESVDGKKFLVLHGDCFDMVTKYAKWASYLGDIGYTLLLKLNKVVHSVRKFFGLKHWSLSKAIKKNVKKAVSFISEFEDSLVKYSRDKNCDGCVCGHIHTPELRFSSDGFMYANSGDWVESCTAIYEDHEGKFHLYQHPIVR